MTWGKASAGQPLRIPADLHNATIDAVEAHLRGKGRAGGSAAGQRPVQAMVQISNDTGGDLAAGSVVGLGDPAADDPTGELGQFLFGELIFSGIAPSATYGHAGRFAVLVEPIADGFVGRAVVQGVVRVKVQIDDLDVADWADIDDGETGNLLAAASGSARILWFEGSSTGTVWAICLIGCGGSGGGGGADTSASFTAHYSLSQYYESYPEECTFWSLAGCLNAFLQICLDVRKCEEDLPIGNHPGNTEARSNGGFAGNGIASWLGDDSEWIELAYTAHDTDGVIIATGVEAITDFHIHARVTTAGLLELRTTNDSLTLSCVISGAVWRKSYPAAPGTIEFGAGGCHDDTTWGDGVWEPPA